MNNAKPRSHISVAVWLATMILAILIALAVAPALGAGGPAIAAGTRHTVLLKGDGSLWTWGRNLWGQLGDGTTTDRTTPVQVSGLPGASAISAGGSHTVVLRSDGSVWAWGYNLYGQVGDGTLTNRLSPVPVSGLTGVVAISAGGVHTLALKSDGTVWAWGYNGYGALGTGTTADRPVPAQVTGLTGVVAVYAGSYHSFARRSDGSVWAWGLNDFSQLCDGTSTNRLTPVPVSGLTGTVSISAGGQFALALKGDSSVWACGVNGDGRLGDGTNITRPTPVPASGLTGVTAISAGTGHSVALMNDGSVRTWGANANGELGDGTTASRSVPGPVSGLTGIAAIAAGLNHTAALKANGSVWSWGQNTYGQLGDGTLTGHLSPVPSSITASTAAPVFPMVVSGTITPAVANITAAIQYRPQDVGTTGSVYVFALAPANLVHNVTADALHNHKGPVVRSTNVADAPLACILAQLNAAGQLTAANAATLQAYLTGVLSSQGASVSVLNGISTALVQGTVFYVGYGTNSTSMINNGINRSVVTVPGTNVCQPQAPQTGWWWNPAEDGRGFGIEVRGNNLFMSGYLYDDSGHATWVVSPGPISLDGSLFNSTMYRVANGQTLNGAYKSPSPPTAAGPITLSFTDARNGTLIWPGGSIPLVRFDTIIGSGNGATPSFVPENGWWWNESESGRGFFLEIKNNFMFIAGYMYEADGRPVWYVAQNPLITPQYFSGTWLQVANGQTMTGPYKQPVIINNNVGPVSIVFQDTTNAVMTLPNGRQLAITRHRF